MSETEATILAVDDDPDALFILDRLLCRDGFRVRTAAGGQAALAALELGVSEFVTKPLNSRDLIARIRAQLHQRALASRLDEMLER